MLSTAFSIGLLPQEFFRLTPRQYHLLLEGHKEKLKHQEWMTGVLASVVANFSMSPPKEPAQPKDFPLWLLKERPKRISRRRIAKNMKTLFAAQIELQKKRGA